MTVITPYGQEIGVVYTMTAPRRTGEAEFNGSGPLNVGNLSAVTGLDSPELIESFGMNVEREGGFNNNNQLGRRPFTLQGEIVPVSLTDRLTKISLLNMASMALTEDGTLQWTTSAGTPVYLKFRRQQPIITSEGWVKKFFFGGVANDPRIYAFNSYQTNLAVKSASEDNSYTMTFASGTEKKCLSMAVQCVAGQPFKLQCWMKVDSTWNGGTPEISVSGGSVKNETISAFNPALKNTWQLVEVLITPSAAFSGTISWSCGSVIPTAGHFIKTMLPRIESELFNGQVGSSAGFEVTAVAGWTLSQEASTLDKVPYNVQTIGGYPSPVKAKIYGPITAFTLINNQNLEPFVRVEGLSLLAGEYIEIDLNARTAIIGPSGTEAYGHVNFATTNWWNIELGLPAKTKQRVSLTNVTGATAKTGAVIEYQDCWV